MQLQRLQARLRWQRTEEGWALQVPRLRLQAEAPGAVWTVPALPGWVAASGIAAAFVLLRGVGISGALQLGVSSWVALACFFGAGVATAMLLS